MLYRKMGKIGFQPSALGFGCMRLPIVDNQFNQVDQELTDKMIHLAIEKGVNYFDTAFVYHGGQSEVALGKALQGGWRERVKIADKMPVWLLQSEEDLDKYFNMQLERLQVEKIDFYLFHALNAKTWQKLLTFNPFAWAEKQKKLGRIEYIGFSFHDGPDVFINILEAYDWDFCQIQYNFMDVSNQAGRDGLLRAAARNVGVVAMEPLRGGDILRNLPPQVEALWQKKPVMKPVPSALRWLWQQPEMSVALSGMHSLQDVEQNIEYASSYTPLTTEENARLDEIRQTYLELKPILCTACDYCNICPQKIAIPHLFSLYNNYSVFHNLSQMRWLLTEIPADNRPNRCLDCKMCEDICPQKLPITQFLQRINKLYEDMGLNQAAN